MKVIREYVNEMEALIARSVLEAHDIPAVVLRDDAGGMLPSMRLIYPVRLAVRSTDAAEALRVLDSPFEDRDTSFDGIPDGDVTGRP